MAPYLLAVLLLEADLVRLGETVPASVVAALQARGRPFIFLPVFSDHNYALKLHAVRRQRPRIVALGASRMNQWRSAMFRPYSFYNAGNSVYLLKQCHRFVDDLADPPPRILLLSIDFYMFDPIYDPTFDRVAFEDMSFWPAAEHAAIVKDFLATAREDPSLLFAPNRDPLYGVPAFGLSAIRKGLGIRIDGSVQAGNVIQGLPNARQTVAEVVARIAAGRRPFRGGDAMDPSHLEELEAIAKVCARRGIVVIGLSAPCAEPVAKALAASARHGVWRQFQDPATAERFRRMGIIYFNFTRFDSFDGDPAEMLDPFHPSEPACVRMLLAMLKDDTVRRLLPAIDTHALHQRLTTATALEVYRNEF